jgi:DNA helicase II / ATP-dependent DNA helicase PcrA
VLPVLPLNDLIPAIRSGIDKFAPRLGRSPAPDAQQEACIHVPATTPLQIVAGPGSGKTTVLVLRALRHVLVDGFLPEQILLTTFTTKAADEIRTRLIQWGLSLVDHLRKHGPSGLQAHLRNVDVNRFMTGTLDSICEDALRTMRASADPAPALLETFAANAIMHRRGLRNTAYNSGAIDPAVATYLAQFSFDGKPPAIVSDFVMMVRPLFDRFAHDMIDVSRFRALSTHASARDLLVRGYDAYVQHLRDTNRLDFALLENEFLARMGAGRLARFTGPIRAILVDEYQDTNLLQESIYFELFVRSGGSLTVVGDDDQSLYRFRGATVELFRDFGARLRARVPTVTVQRLDLINNYRSTPEVVAFFNSFIANDPDFAPARVQPPKPPIRAQLPSSGAPILGMFRSDVTTLAKDLASFLCDIFRGNGRKVKSSGQAVTISKAQDGGDFGDAVLLAHTVNEFVPAFMVGDSPRPRLPYYLRQELAKRNVHIFNPRGRALRDVPDVQQLLGAMLECLDPGGALQGQMPLRGHTHQYLASFRTEYAQYAAANPPPTNRHGLQAFVKAWGTRTVLLGTDPWPREWPVLELCFTLLAWFPRLRDDPEGQVYLEAVTRAIAQSATFSPYRALVYEPSQAPHDRRSVESALRDIFQPIAEGLIDVDEEIMPSVPRDRFTLMTIHQAKGLEFPLVVVDVSSDFGTNHQKTRFKRFPEQLNTVTCMEDDLASICAVGSLRQQRTTLQRTFEDLIRLYYVGYSRAQSALLLVGLDPCLRYTTTIRHVATFWRSNGTWPWRGPYATKKPPGMVNAHPLELI